MRWIARVAVMLFGLLLGVAGAAAAADPIPTPTPSSSAQQPAPEFSADPNTAQYSPDMWARAWDPEKPEVVASMGGDAKTGLTKSGLLTPYEDMQWNALSVADRTTVSEAWRSGLVEKVHTRLKQWMSAVDYRYQNANPPPWSAKDSDAAAAKMLGGKDYKSLSPGLKSVVERIAHVVSGDVKPPMPDAEWRQWMSPEVKAAWDQLPDTRYDWRRRPPVTNGGDTPGGTNATITVCPEAWYQSLCEFTRGAADVVGNVIDISKDPLGWLAQKAGEGAQAILGWIAGVANDATGPNLNAQWWVDQYAKGFAVGVMLLILVLLWMLVQRARGKISASELFEVFILRAPAYFAGAVFGPPIANFLIQGAAAMSDDLIKSWTGSNASDGMSQVKAAAGLAGAAGVTGGAFVALILLLVVIIAGAMIFVALCVQTATIYLSSAVFAVAFAWVAHVKHQGGSLKIPLLVIGLTFSRPLLFFLLGIGLSLTRKALVSAAADPPAQGLAMLIMAVVVMLISAFAPLLLLKFAPVFPHGNAAATSGVGSGGAVVAGAGGAALGGSMLSRLASARSSRLSSRARPTAGGGRGSTGLGAALGGGGRGGSSSAVAADGGSGDEGSAGGSSPVSLDKEAEAPTSALSTAVDRSGPDADATTTGMLLGRTRRHGGGEPSPQAQLVAQARPDGSGPTTTPASAPLPGRPKWTDRSMGANIARARRQQARKDRRGTRRASPVAEPAAASSSDGAGDGSSAGGVAAAAVEGAAASGQPAGDARAPRVSGASATRRLVRGSRGAVSRRGRDLGDAVGGDQEW